MKIWTAKGQINPESITPETVVDALLKARSITTDSERDEFFHPKSPLDLTPEDVGIDPVVLGHVIERIRKAIAGRESIVVYADYDADGVTAGAVLWEALHRMGANVMPYIPHRKEEGYGFSEKGLRSVKETYNPTLVISVDHGVTAREMIPLAASLGMEIIVTDHHLKPDNVPECLMVHTTMLSGAGVSWFLSNQLLKGESYGKREALDILPFAAIGTIADLVPLTGPNRSIVTAGLSEIRTCSRVGLKALFTEAGIDQLAVSPYHISHMIAPRINAMGRLTHAMDSLRLLCTNDAARAQTLADILGSTNRERQAMTTQMLVHAKSVLSGQAGDVSDRSILIVSHDSYDQGIIGLVAGRLTEEHYRPTIVMAVGETVSKGSARSIPGFNIVEAIRQCQDLLIDVGGHPAAAGFTIATERIGEFIPKLESIAAVLLTPELLTRSYSVDLEIPVAAVTEDLYEAIKPFAPYGLGNPEPSFASSGVRITDVRLIGKEGKHLKFKCIANGRKIDAVAFNQSAAYSRCLSGDPVDLIYTVDMNVWNGNASIQLAVKSIT